MKPIRNSAKAIIIENGKVLLTKNKDDSGYFYLFPGGGQEHGEELKDAVQRECIEETGESVLVHDLVYVREYIGKNHEFASWDGEVHQVEFYFQCSLVSRDAGLTNGENPDDDQVGVEWIEISRLEDIRLYPKQLGNILQNPSWKGCYLGDTN